MIIGLDMTNDRALAHFKRAREHYVSRRFELAQQDIRKYRQSVDYQKFDQSDRRTVSAPQISVVVVTHQAGPKLLSCLQSVLAQEGPSFEVILVANGGHEHFHGELAQLPLLTVKAPVNLLPAEGRNTGAHFARADLIVFLDDDAVMAQGYLANGLAAMKDDSRMGLRGQAVSKTPHKTAPPHYSLGQRPKPAEFNLEGNMLIRKTVLEAVGGFDALMFGHEGKELTQRCMRQFPDKVIQYRPELCIAHDFAEMDLLEAKRARQSLGQDYLKFLQGKHMNPGISILVRAGDDLAAAHDFLESLVQHNSYKPIEVLLIAYDAKNALKIIRNYLTKFIVRIISPSDNSLSSIAAKARHEYLLLIDLPTNLKKDVLEDWVRNQKSSVKSALLCQKNELGNFSDIEINIPLSKLSNKIARVKTALASSKPPEKIIPDSEPAQPEASQAPKNVLLPKAGKTASALKVLVVSPRQLGILGTPGTYLFVEALANWVDLVVLCNSDGKPSEKTPQVHTPSANLRVMEASFSKGIDRELRTLTESFVPDIVHIMVWQKWPDLATVIRQFAPGAKLVLDIKTPLLAEGTVREQVQSSGNAHVNLIDLIMTRQIGEEKTWIPDNEKPVSEYPLAIDIGQIDGSDVLRNTRPLKCVYIGSIHPKREIERLLWLISHLDPDLRHAVKLDIYGAGGSAQDLLQLAHQYHLDGQVRVLDPIPQQVLFPKLKEYDIGIAWVPWGEYDLSPSLKFLEYAASRLTIIATDTFAHKRNVEEGFEAHLFDNTPSGLGRALAEANEQIHRRRMLDKNYLLACTRDWNIISQHYFTYAYRRLMLDDASAESIKKSLSSVFNQITEMPEFVIRHPFVQKKLELIREKRNDYKFF